uniref:Zinc finger GRF-type domain-containing protein n=1 Tax=Plectus sambesii TaxID=2011161 RepID=A0A914X5T6_9BILA
MKRKQRSSEPNDRATRTRGLFKIILEHDHVVPSCPHGPCLLFERQKEGGQQFFSCAVHRSNKCSFHRTVVANKVARSSAAAIDIDEPSHQLLRKRFVRLAKNPDEASFCRTCSALISSDKLEKHAESAGHSVIQGLTKQQLLRPTTLLTALSNNDSEAQYWFDQNTLDVVRSLVTSGAFNGVLCVGAPVVFEELRAKKVTRVFLLDYDARFMKFIKPTEMARYSMLVDHFFDARGAEECARFLAETNKLLIVADPPFGAMVSPLLKSLEQIAQRHKLLHEGASVECRKLVALPYFLEKQVKDYDANMKITDFKVSFV